MKRGRAIGLLGLSIGFLVLLGSSSSAEASEASKPPSSDADPLPSYSLTQAHVVESIAALYESGESERLTSLLIKAKSASVGMRAYIAAMLAAMPERLKQDAAFARDLEKSEALRLQRLAETQKGQKAALAIVDAAATILGAIVPGGSAIYSAARKGLEAGVSYGIDKEVPGVDVGVARNAIAQMLPGREGYELRRGVSLTPLLPYVTKEEIDRADALRRQWWEEMQADADWQSLPPVQQNTPFRFSPKWDEWKQAVRQIRGEA